MPDFHKGKHLTAVRKSGNVYDVFFSDHNGCDFDMPFEYINRLRRKGYSVTVEQRSYRGEGEPETEEYSPLAD
jgi:hypothetical protein